MDYFHCSCLNMGFSLMNDNQDCRQNQYLLYTAGNYAGPLVETACSSFYVCLLSKMHSNVKRSSISLEGKFIFYLNFISNICVIFLIFLKIFSNGILRGACF